jgi:DNA ligase-1
VLFSELAEYYEKLEGVSSRLAMVDILSELFKKADKEEVPKVIYITQGVLAPPFEGVEFGMAEKLVEESIAIATGYSKAEVEKVYRSKGDMGAAAMELRGKSKLKRIGSSSYTVLEVYAHMLKMANTSGQGSKDIKVKMLANLIAAATPVEAKYLAKYPLDELRMGVGDATVLESLSKAATGDRKLKAELENAYNLCSDLGLVGEELMRGGEEAIRDFRISMFRPIRPALAERLPTAEQILEKMHGIAAVEQKYDGFRCQVHKDGKKVRIFSRRLENTTDMFPDLVEATIKEIGANRIIFDGEALAFNEDTGEFMPFQETIKRKRKYDIEETAASLPLHLFAFDILYLNGEDYMKEPYRKRREELEKLLKGNHIIVPSSRIVTKSPKELEGFFEKSIEGGLEGIVAKDLESRYKPGAREFSWIKMKRSYKGELSDTIDLVIIGYYRGKGMRNEFQFGGLLGAVYNEKRDMFESISRIGSGFTEVQMVELREKLERISVKSKPARVDSVVEPDFWVTPKYVVTVKADEITKSPTHTCGKEKEKDGSEVGYALRFPRLVGEETIRKDKGPEETTTTNEIIEMYNQQRRVKVEGK